MNKICGKCKNILPLTLFNKNKAKKDGYSNACRECQKIYKNNHYQQNKEKVYDSNKKRRQDISDFIWNYKMTHSCVDCGFSNPKALDFDHVKGVKLFDISKSSTRGFSNQKIMEEIKKCEVRCANCHRIVTHDRAKRIRNLAV